jgi:hypothetical protein
MTTNPKRKRERKYEHTPEGRRAHAASEARRRARLRQLFDMVDESPAPRESRQ